jgi:hypothetical protein
MGRYLLGDSPNPGAPDNRSMTRTFVIGSVRRCV